MESDKGFAALSLDSASTSIEPPVVVSIDADGVPYLVALHSDPQLSEKVKYKLKSGGVTVGSSSDCDIQLGGIYVLDHHCTLTCEEVLALKPAEGRIRNGAGIRKRCRNASCCA